MRARRGPGPAPGRALRAHRAPPWLTLSGERRARARPARRPLPSPPLLPAPPPGTLPHSPLSTPPPPPHAHPLPRTIAPYPPHPPVPQLRCPPRRGAPPTSNRVLRFCRTTRHTAVSQIIAAKCCDPTRLSPSSVSSRSRGKAAGVASGGVVSCGGSGVGWSPGTQRRPRVILGQTWGWAGPTSSPRHWHHRHGTCIGVECESAWRRPPLRSVNLKPKPAMTDQRGVHVLHAAPRDEAWSQPGDHGPRRIRHSGRVLFPTADPNPRAWLLPNSPYPLPS